MNRTKIDWADFSWNPVVGCLRGCEYCYARKMAHRFGWDFKPHWVSKAYVQSIPQKPSFIFVGSMSDPEYWEQTWIEYILAKAWEYQGHTFLFLTKNAKSYCRFKRTTPNVWFGVTATDNRSMVELHTKVWAKSFISFEPLLEEITVLEPIEYTDWVIIGAETGNRKGRVRPKAEWIKRIVDTRIRCGKPVWMKNNLRPYYSGKWYQQRPEVRKP